MSEFVPFRFRVSLFGEAGGPVLCGGAFSEVSGFELTMEPRAIREGGRNWGEHQRCGQTRFAPIVLKRGVTSIDDLWQWFDIVTRGANFGYRLQGEILVLGNPAAQVAQGTLQSVSERPMLRWKLQGVLPTRFKGPDLSATASQVAIEEITLVHEGIELERPDPAGVRS